MTFRTNGDISRRSSAQLEAVARATEVLLELPARLVGRRAPRPARAGTGPRRSRRSSAARSWPSNAMQARPFGVTATNSSPIGESTRSDGDVDLARRPRPRRAPTSSAARARDARLGGRHDRAQVLRSSHTLPEGLQARAHVGAGGVVRNTRARRRSRRRDGRAGGGAPPRPAASAGSAATAAQSVVVGRLRAGERPVGDRRSASGRRARAPMVVDRRARGDPQDPPVEPAVVAHPRRTRAGRTGTSPGRRRRRAPGRPRPRGTASPSARARRGTARTAAACACPRRDATTPGTTRERPARVRCVREPGRRAASARSSTT